MTVQIYVYRNSSHKSLKASIGKKMTPNSQKTQKQIVYNGLKDKQDVYQPAAANKRGKSVQC